MELNRDVSNLIAENNNVQKTLDDCLERINRWEGIVRAWEHVDADGARATALEMDRANAQGGVKGPLHGMPIGVKDIVAVRGMPTRAGSSLPTCLPVECDAPAIARLRDAGAIILGKTVTTEWACFDPPPTRNPWNLAHTPGGSSSGSAAAVAMGMCVVAVGSQTGGSVIRPGSYCGVYSCKPTHGAISLENVIPLSPELDHLGAFARSIGDLSAVITAMIHEPTIERRAPNPLTHVPLFGVIEEYFYDEADAEVVQITRQAVEKLTLAGAEVRKVALPSSFYNVHEAHRQMLAYRASRYHRAQFEKHSTQFGPHVTAVIRGGADVSDSDYAAALLLRDQFQKELGSVLADFDAILTPATPTSAPAMLSTTGDLKFNSPWSFSGFPVVSLPIGLDSSGMPLAIQLTGRFEGDVDLLSVAEWCEQALPFAVNPQGFKKP